MATSFASPSTRRKEIASGGMLLRFRIAGNTTSPASPVVAARVFPASPRNVVIPLSLRMAMPYGLRFMIPITACTGAPLVTPAMIEEPSARPNVSDPDATICTARPEPCPSPMVRSIPFCL